MDIFDQIAAGVRPSPPLSTRTNKSEPSVVELQLSYAIAKQVPAMDRGFTISTSYGEIEIVAGPLAERLQIIVREALERELAAMGAQV